MGGRSDTVHRGKFHWCLPPPPRANGRDASRGINTNLYVADAAVMGSMRSKLVSNAGHEAAAISGDDARASRDPDRRLAGGPFWNSIASRGGVVRNTTSKARPPTEYYWSRAAAPRGVRGRWPIPDGSRSEPGGRTAI